MSSPRPDTTRGTGSSMPDGSSDRAAVSATAEALARIQYGNRALAHLYTGSWEDFAHDLLRSAWLAARETAASDRGALGVADRILRLHRPRDANLALTNCALQECQHDSCPTVATVVCGHCADHGGPNDDWLYVIGEAAIWPCPTVRAIAPALDPELPDSVPRDLDSSVGTPTSRDPSSSYIARSTSAGRIWAPPSPRLSRYPATSNAQ